MKNNFLISLRSTTRMVLLIIVTLFFHLNDLVAQGATTAALAGAVVDEKGEGLPGASIIAIHEPTGTQYGTVSRDDGGYNIANMRVGGPYKITVSFVGFEDFTVGNIFLTVSQELRQNVKLEVNAAVLDEVQIIGARGAVINSGRSGPATTVGNKAITTLPTLNRSLQDFARLDPRSNGGLSFGGRNSLYNNITVDGAYFNNAFGLQSTIGSQANAQPVSVDAIDQFQVNIAPYDVRQGLSTGANINIVTKSGTNDFSGSVYTFYRDTSLLGKKISGVTTSRVPFTFDNTQFGARFGGPIIKNKAFFFVAYEQEARNTPGSNGFVANRPGVTPAPGTGSNTSDVLASDLDGLKDFLIKKFNYNPGEYENYQREARNKKFNVRLDFNLAQNHKLNIKYNLLNSYADISPSTSGALSGGRNPTSTNLPFQASLYRIFNNLHSVIGELNSTFSNTLSNSFTVGYTSMRDIRESPVGTTPFPTVDIGNGRGLSMTSFGYEPFSANNKLNSDIFQISNNVSLYMKKNVFTVGAAFEANSFVNGFAPNYYGGYQFASLKDFYTSVDSNKSTAIQFRQQSSNYAEFPFAKMKGNMVSLYAQDEYTAGKGLKLTFGIRGDGVFFPVQNDDGRYTNKFVPNLTFRDGLKLATDRFPKFTMLVSPRLGFNWDVMEKGKTQVRGGTGVFSGRVPYVWLSNQLSNNGVLFNSESRTQTSNPKVPVFSANVDAYRPVADPSQVKPTSYNLAVTEENFKFPQVWRSNLAVAHNLTKGWIVEGEVLYTKDLNAVYNANVNLPNSTVRAIGADNRPIYYNVGVNGFPSTANNRIYGSIPTAQGGNTVDKPNISDAILMKNTNEGSSFVTTLQVSKQFRNGLLGAAYNYTDAKSVNDGGSIAQSIWRDRAISGDPNATALSYSTFMLKHRVIAYGSYKLSYLNNVVATTIGFSYAHAAGPRFTYTYAGDMNGDGSGGGGNDLIYIPRDQSEILLTDITRSDATKYTAAQQWADLDKYINQDKYLSARRGQYAERNGGVLPSIGTLDLKIVQDFNIRIAGKVNTFQFTFDVFNFTNLLKSSWGVDNFVTRQALLTFGGYDNTGATATGKPRFTYPEFGGKPLTSTFQESTGLGSRWSGQLGVRYIFN